MRILFVADGRSAIALNWIRGMIDKGHEIHLASTFPCEANLPFSSLTFIPVAFSAMKKQPPRSTVQAETRIGGGRKLGGAALVQVRTLLRQWLGPMTLASASRKLSEVVDRVQPDLVHAMRIPYEGMITALALQEVDIPLLVSIWGNDFTLHAPANPWMGNLTRRTLFRADAVHADCRRDVRYAYLWGFDPARPSVVLPGAGGIQLDVFYPPVVEQPSSRAAHSLINPRGVRAYVRNDAFFKAMPVILNRFPDCRILCTGMMGDRQISRWVRELGFNENVELLPKQSRSEMAALFRKAQLAVSPSTHDGTPNTLLEAMACGCLPIAGDLESLREWITPGVNGLLIDPTDPTAISAAIILGFENPDLRKQAGVINRQLIEDRAEFNQTITAGEDFYHRLINRLGG